MNNANSMSEADEGDTGLMHWLLLSGNRLAVAGIGLVGIDGLFFAAGILGLLTMTTPNRMMWFLNGTVNGLLTLVPIAVGVNQIVLSHEFGSIDSLYERRKDVTQFRKRVEGQTGEEVSSPRAASLFRLLFKSVSDTAASVEEAHDPSDDRSRDDIESYVQSVVTEATEMDERLAEEERGILGTLLVVLEFEDSIKFYENRRLKSSSNQSPELEAKLDELEELFILIDSARQYLKTVVVERQLARLSRLLIFTGLLAVVAAVVGIFSYRDVAGLTPTHPVQVLIAGTLVTVTLVPLAVLSAYILRVATIARGTATFSAFVSSSE